jgi:hypothetical protein
MAYLLITGLLNLLTLSAEIANNGLYAQLVNDAHAFAGHAHTYKTLLTFHPEAMVVQIRLETTLGLDVRVGNIVTDNGTLPGNLANLGHNGLRGRIPPCTGDSKRQLGGAKKDAPLLRGAIYTRAAPPSQRKLA